MENKICLWCRKPGGTCVVKYPKTAGVAKGNYHAACLIKAKAEISSYQK